MREMYSPEANFHEYDATIAIGEEHRTLIKDEVKRHMIAVAAAKLARNCFELVLPPLLETWQWSHTREALEKGWEGLKEETSQYIIHDEKVYDLRATAHSPGLTTFKCDIQTDAVDPDLIPTAERNYRIEGINLVNGNIAASAHDVWTKDGQSYERSKFYFVLDPNKAEQRTRLILDEFDEYGGRQFAASSVALERLANM